MVRIIDGMTADEYTDSATRDYIKQRYDSKYAVVENPYTNPEKYDPLNPPDGWKYDPFTEFWVRTHVTK